MFGLATGQLSLAGVISAGLCWFTMIFLACLPADVLGQDDDDYLAGQALFERHWVSPPASAAASDGLGPYYNARACVSCHPDGGAGLAGPSPEDTFPPLVIHLIDEPSRSVFGRQWQPHAVRGLEPEDLHIKLGVRQKVFIYPDGESVELVAPFIADWHAGQRELSGSAVLSLRMAQDLHGMAVLVDAMAGAGRFGWQGSHASLDLQIAHALSADMGLGSPLLPGPGGDCTLAQTGCLALAAATLSGTEPETSEVVLDLLAAYVVALPVPEVPAFDDTVQGLRTFRRLGCNGCHSEFLARADGSRQAFFSDLELHDLGLDLADMTPDNGPVPARWRTPPLWRMAERLAIPGSRFLHDGRAANPEQAILWHGGEAGRVREAFVALPAGERLAFLAWLGGL